jgi:hypothetical protein
MDLMLRAEERLGGGFSEKFQSASRGSHTSRAFKR